MSRLHEEYLKSIKPNLMKELGYMLEKDWIYGIEFSTMTKRRISGLHVMELSVKIPHHL